MAQTKAKTLTKDQLITVGFDLASNIMQAEKDMEQTKRKYILSVATSYRMPEQQEAILTGYRQYYIDNGAKPRVADARKAELNAIFKAVNKTEVTEEGSEHPSNVKLLEEFEGTYHAWLTYARELSGKQQRKSPDNTTRNKSALTEKQQAKLHEALGDASTEQLVAVATDSVKNIIAHTPKADKDDKESLQKATMAGKQSLLLIRATAGSIASSDKFDDLIRKTAQSVLDIVNPVIEQLEANEKKAEEVITMAQGEKIAA